jgi:predicted MFS family arabinose efflux permease
LLSELSEVRSAEAAKNASYLGKIRSFSSNAKLYIVHVFGMDFIYGTWEVLFNLYLLAIGFDPAFIGLRLIIGGVAGALSALPAGMISDRIGRKASFITGDGGNAAFSLIEITSLNSTVLLITPVFRSIFGTLHGVTEPPFMAENSKPLERVHLFSVATGVRTIAAMAGAFLVAGFPLLDVSLGQKIFYYRVAASIGIVGWFLSLVPALLLKEIVRHEPSRNGRSSISLGNLQSKSIVSKLLITEGLIAVGAGLALPFLNVYFQRGLHVHEAYIGTTFAMGSLFLASASFVAPFVSNRLGKVHAIFAARTLSVPFILVLAYTALSPTLTFVALVASVAYIGRTSIMNMSGPIADAFTMELLVPGERATFVGLESTTSQILSGTASLLGGIIMNRGDFATPLIAMAALYLFSNVLYLRFFRNASTPGLESELQLPAH